MATVPTVTTLYTLDEAEQDIADLRGQVDAMQEILQLFDGPVPSSPQISGAQLFSTNGQPNYVNFTGLQMSLMGAKPVAFPNNTVTAAALGNLTTFTIPAADADTGAVYELEVWGNGQQGTVGNRQTLQFAVVLGGTSMATVQFGTTALPDTSAIFRWRAAGRVICNTTGVTGTWTSYLLVTLSQFNVNYSIGNANFAQAFSCEATGTVTKDTTASETLSIQAAWGATTGAPTLTSQVACFKRLC